MVAFGDGWQTGAVPSEPGEPLIGVSETALGAAEIRAEESLRPDRLVEDPFATAFVAAAPPLFPDLPSIVDDPVLAALKDDFVTGVAIRHPVLRRLPLRGVRSGVPASCSPGGRARHGASRLRWPTELRLFEVDLPDLFVFKERVLAQQGATPKSSRVVVGVDLRDDWAARLIAAGFDPNQLSAWTAEGLLPYLSNDDAARLLTNIGELCTTGSRLSFDYDEFADESALGTLLATPAMHEVASMWAGGLAENPVEWMRAHGWQVDTRGRAEMAASYGRRLAERDRIPRGDASCCADGRRLGPLAVTLVVGDAWLWRRRPLFRKLRVYLRRSSSRVDRGSAASHGSLDGWGNDRSRSRPAA